VSWRQVLLLYVLLGLLGGEFWLFERRRVERPQGQPERERFLALQPGQLREVRLRRGGRTVVTRRDADGWAVVEPAGATIPPDLIDAFATALTGAEEIARVGDAQADPRAYGFDERAVQVEIIAETGEPVLVTIGETNPTGTAVYARRGGNPVVVLIGRNVRYYEDLIFQALPSGQVPAADVDAPVGG
jgi:Domain of unknown function (DUF4340)